MVIEHVYADGCVCGAVGYKAVVGATRIHHQKLLVEV